MAGVFSAYRAQYFSYLQNKLRVLDGPEYEEAYRPVKEAFGVSSPAFANLKNNSVIISADVPDVEYIDFLATHEFWELYIVNKKGFNFAKKELADVKRPVYELQRSAHRFAIYKEFQHAAKKGKVDAYMDWWRDFYSKNAVEVSKADAAELKRVSGNYHLDGNENPRISIIHFIFRN